MNRSEMLFIVSILSIFVAIKCNSDNLDEKSVSTSVVGMVPLLDAERQLIDALDNYAKDLQNKVDVMQDFVAERRLDKQKSQNNPEEFLSNPLNGFSLIRRIYDDWIKIKDFLVKPVGEDQIRFIQKKRAEMPTQREMIEAAEGMNRLQYTYGLDVTDMAAGLLHGKQYNSDLSSLDCFTIGHHLMNNQQPLHAEMWLYRALESYKDNELSQVLGFKRLDIVQLYVTALLEQNRPEDALYVVKTELSVNPQSENLLRKSKKLKKLVKEKQQNKKLKNTNLMEMYKAWIRLPHYALRRSSLYERSCRGDFSERVSNLQCRYNSTTTPFLRLAPLKMEEIQLDPYIVVYHDVITDKEINGIKASARPQLKRDKVYFNQDADLEALFYGGRISSSTFLPDNTSFILERFNRRLVDMTGFDLKDGLPLNVVNYGLSGFFEPHCDFLYATKDDEKAQELATVITFLSDVEQGGATVFPKLGTSIFPRKGSALLFYNLDSRLIPNEQTLHAACPVIVGSRWIATKWIHEDEQIFRYPCYK